MPVVRTDGLSGGRAAVFGHVITKFSRMGRLLHFLTHGAPLARLARASSTMNVELTSYIGNKQNVGFEGKDIPRILGYSNTKKAILTHIDEHDKQRIFTPHASGPKMAPVAPSGSICTYINESGFYSLILSSKLETAKKFNHWVTSQVLLSV